MHIIVVEGDTPSVIQHNRAQGQRTNSQRYCDALMAIDPALALGRVEPYRDSQAVIPPGVQGVVFTGSGVDFSVDAPDAEPLRQMMEQAFAAGIPVLGSCNGMQLAAVVLGGRVGPSPNGFELGLARNIRLTEAGARHALHAGRTPPFSAPCIHRDEVRSLPTGAVVTAFNDHSPVQAMVYESDGVRFWGMQYHPEIAPSEIATIVASDGLFAGGAHLADELRAAEAADDDLTPHRRGLELRHWLASL